MVKSYPDRCNTAHNLVFLSEFYVYSCITSDMNFEKPKELPRNSRDRKESVGPKKGERICRNNMKHKRIPEKSGNSDYFHCG